MAIPPWVAQKLDTAQLVKLDSGNALTGPLKFCAVSPFAWAFAYLFKDAAPLATTLVAVGSVPILVCAIVALRLLWTKPELMKSDHMQLREHALDMISQRDYSADDLRALERIVTAPLNDPPLLPAARNDRPTDD